MTPYTLAAFVLVTIAAVILLVLLRGRRIKEKYVWLWLGLLAGVLALLSAPALATQVSRWLGFQVLANLIFVLSVVVLFGVSVVLSVSLSKTEENVRTLAEEIAYLRYELERDRAPREALGRSRAGGPADEEETR